MQNQSALHRLASRVGILPSYVDQTGTETRVTSDETRVAILRAMGMDASTGERAREALEAMETRERERVVAPVRVVRANDPDAATVSLRAPEGAGTAEWELELVRESGGPVRLAGTAQPEWDGSFTVSLGEAPPEGYHALRAVVRAGGGERSGEQSLIVVPDACPSVAGVAGRERVFGVIANLYSVRGAGDWGIGDVSVLARLMEWTGSVGGAFVGVNPLHALRNRGTDVSPYSPVSRVFRNPVYLDVEAVPGLRECEEARRLLESPDLRRERDGLRAGNRVEYDRVMALKRRVLEAAYRACGPHAGEDFRRWAGAQGEALAAFATFEALADR
ncbi:MAG TPA: 4-alpha-glucanotransferase, partial [Longimicrobiaceae bacterium]